MTGIVITPLQPSFGAQVRGVDLRGPLAPDAFAAIEAAFNRY